MLPIISRTWKAVILAATFATMTQAQELNPQSPARDSVKQARAIVGQFAATRAEAESGQAANEARRDPTSEWTGLRLGSNGSAFVQTDPNGLRAKNTENARQGIDVDVTKPQTVTIKAPTSPDAPAPPAGAKRGSSGATINATAESVVAIANRGTAVAEIGVDVTGGRANVSAENVVVIANGQDSRTSIGGCNGTVSANGIYNSGGTIDICSSGTRRDGKTCIEIFNNTCIVHRYIRPKKKPCLPGYWTQIRLCRLPADNRHVILDD